MERGHEHGDETAARRADDGYAFDIQMVEEGHCICQFSIRAVGCGIACILREPTAAFARAKVPEPMAGQIAKGQLGEALLRGISLFNQGLGGDLGALTDALALLRAVGMEDVARRTALQYLLLDRQT